MASADSRSSGPATIPAHASRTDRSFADLEVTGVKLLDSWTIDMENANRVGRGFLVGTVFAVCATLSFDVMVALNRTAKSPTWTFPQRLFVGLTVTFLVAGCLCGLTAACYRPLRRLGTGILLGLTIMFPLAFLLGFALMWEGN